MLRPVALLATGLAMTASIGLAGAGATSAASPEELHIKAGSMWTAKINLGDGGGACEVDTFSANHTFTSDFRDRGTWSGGGNKVAMIWTKGYVGLTFSGTYTTTPRHEYIGTFGGPAAGDKGRLIKGAIAPC
jgi:hypothetical protein